MMFKEKHGQLNVAQRKKTKLGGNKKKILEKQTNKKKIEKKFELFY